MRNDGVTKLAMQMLTANEWERGESRNVTVERATQPPAAGWVFLPSQGSGLKV